MKKKWRKWRVSQKRPRNEESGEPDEGSGTSSRPHDSLKCCSLLSIERLPYVLSLFPYNPTSSTAYVATSLLNPS